MLAICKLHFDQHKLFYQTKCVRKKRHEPSIPTMSLEWTVLRNSLDNGNCNERNLYLNKPLHMILSLFVSLCPVNSYCDENNAFSFSLFSIYNILKVFLSERWIVSALNCVVSNIRSTIEWTKRPKQHKDIIFIFQFSFFILTINGPQIHCLGSFISLARSTQIIP